MGATTALRSVVLATAATSAAVLRDRCSRGDAVLHRLRALPTCAGVVGVHDAERRGRVVRTLIAELARRQSSRSDAAEPLLLAVDGLPTLLGGAGRARGGTASATPCGGCSPTAWRWASGASPRPNGPERWRPRCSPRSPNDGCSTSRTRSTPSRSGYVPRPCPRPSPDASSWRRRSLDAQLVRARRVGSARRAGGRTHRVPIRGARRRARAGHRCVHVAAVDGIGRRDRRWCSVTTSPRSVRRRSACPTASTP